MDDGDPAGAGGDIEIDRIADRVRAEGEHLRAGQRARDHRPQAGGRGGVAHRRRQADVAESGAAVVAAATVGVLRAGLRAEALTEELRAQVPGRAGGGAADVGAHAARIAGRRLGLAVARVAVAVGFAGVADRSCAVVAGYQLERSGVGQESSSVHVASLHSRLLPAVP